MAPVTPLPGTSSSRILVCEDQDSIRNMIETLVSSRGYEVESVTSGAKAIDVATMNPPAMLLLDLMLPGEFDGFEVCRRLRSIPGTSLMPILVISALDDAKSREKASDAGATAYYTKPFSPMALLREIDRIHG